MQNGRVILFIAGCLTGSVATLIYLSPRAEYSKKSLASQCLGYMTWQNITRTNKDISIDEFARGLKMSSMPNNLSEREAFILLDELEQEAFEKCAKENLTSAETFLSKISSCPTVHEIIPDKLYYEVIHAGHGKKVERASTVICHYTIVDAHNSCLSDTRQSGEPKELILAELIPGFSMGIQNMREGERRKLYVHPDLGYRNTHWIAPPQSLLIIDIELHIYNN